MDNPAIYIPMIGVAFVAIYLLSFGFSMNTNAAWCSGLVECLRKPKGRG